MTRYFTDMETTRQHNGYLFKVEEALTIVILGSMCTLRNVSQIHQWATHEHVAQFLAKHFNITHIPCYYWLLSLLKIIKPKSLNACFIRWVQSFLPDGVKNMTLSCDGKTIRSTGKMARHKGALHVVSAHIAQLGMTFAQQAVDDKSNEIPAVRELLELLQLEGCVVVADALHCQKETAQVIVAKKADYLLCVKDNQPDLKQDIADYVQDDVLRKAMDCFETHEKNGGRLEHRRAFSTCDVDWLPGKEQWPHLACMGAVHARVTTKKGQSDEWRYYLSSRTLSAQDLLQHARNEWSVESLHWLLDVHFCEDFCRIEDKVTQQNLNIARKIALNCLRHHKANAGLKSPLSKMMLNCLLECQNLLPILASGGEKIEKTEEIEN